MKKLTIILIGIVFAGVSVIYAQPTPMSNLFSLLDSVITKSPETAILVLDALDSYEKKTTDSNKLTLITQIRTFVKTKYTQVTTPGIPPGRRSFPVQNIDQVLQIIHTKGSEDAPILLMEFLDFQCPYCKRQHNDNILNELREVEFPGKLRTAAVNFPLTGKRHELAQQAAQSAECAYVQGGNDIFYAHKAGLYRYGLQPTMNVIRAVASENGLDPVRMQACIDEEITAQAVQAQKNLGISLGVSGTPGSVVLDTRSGAYKTIRGAVSIDVFMDTIQQLQ